MRFQVVTLDTKHDCILALDILQSAVNLPCSRNVQPLLSRKKAVITFCIAPHPTIFQCLSITLIMIYKKLNTESLYSILKLTSYLSLVAICNCSSGLRASPKILSLASAYSCSLWNKTTNWQPSQCCLCCPLTPGTRTQNLLEVRCHEDHYVTLNRASPVPQRSMRFTWAPNCPQLGWYSSHSKFYHW